MATSTDQHVVELLLDTTNVQSALDELTNSGAVDKSTADAFKQTTEALKKQAQEARKANEASKPLKKTFEDVSKAAKNMSTSFMAGVQDGIADALTEAGVSAEQFETALEGAVSGSKSLKTELRETVQALAQMKLNGDDNTETYQRLVQRAGELKDSLADANAEIANAGSDTRGLDNLIGTAQAVAGGFAVAQGVVGLFGSESEELQKTLLRVNSAMAILQGLQQVANALQKEGAVTLLVSNTQRKIQNAQLIVQTGLESKSVVVRGLATAAQYALNTAMSLNPIGAVVLAVAGLITALTIYNRITGEAEAATGELNAALKASSEGFDESADAIRKLGDRNLAYLKANGAAQSEVLKFQAEQEKGVNQDRINNIELLRKAEAAANAAGIDFDADERRAVRDQITKLEKDGINAVIDEQVRGVEIAEQLRQEDYENAVAFAERRVTLAGEGTAEQLAAQKALIDARLALEKLGARDSAAETKKLEAQANKEKLQAQADYNRRVIDGRIAALNNELILVREGTEEEYILRRKLLEQQTKAELTNTKLSDAERVKVREAGNKQIALLDRNFSEATRKRAIENEISKNAALIELLNGNEEDKRELSIQNITYAAQLEIDAARDNADKIKEIIAKRDADILQVRKKFLEDAAKYEADLVAVDNGPIRRALEKRLSGDLAVSLAGKKSAISQLRDLDVAAINASIATIDEEYQQRLISDKEYELQRKQLLDQRVAANDAAEERITKTTKEANQARVELILATAQSTLGLLSQLADIQAGKEGAEIARRRQQLEELKEAGAITEKEALARSRRIDAEERAAKRRQAIREKALAIFDAVLNTAQGVTNAISTGDPYTAALRAAIVGAIGAAQIAIIAARPIPQFGKGKSRTNKYQGIAEVGETGPEIIERNGRKYITDKPTITYLGKNDIVYNPTQTKRMLENSPNVDVKVMTTQRANGEKFNYDEMGRAFAKHVNIPQTNVNIGEDRITVSKGMSNRDYFINRYR